MRLVKINKYYLHEMVKFVDHGKFRFVIGQGNTAYIKDGKLERVGGSPIEFDHVGSNIWLICPDVEEGYVECNPCAACDWKGFEKPRGKAHVYYCSTCEKACICETLDACIHCKGRLCPITLDKVQEALSVLECILQQ